MKKELLTLVIGILIGAIIATGIFLVLKDDSSSDAGNMQEMGGGRSESFDENMTFDGEAPGDLDINNIDTNSTAEE